ncbi:hypothetical protein CDO52_01165 [Nocardiopsis gilva YIM 90087]|uniref:Uncharacterized protein n=1 Tax=Nocardiopsis gilva YIM 90087 TaxID=1235441 RepID=A0A223S0C8_9ACTN|nr:hypothetical protein [Nocardiopsis gilva]ASU81585.1 hypothetical protein CDO52_01165 [Nocardiopsis gilva YIM 90087]
MIFPQLPPGHLGDIFTEVRQKAEGLDCTLTWHRTDDGWRFHLTDHVTGTKRTHAYLAVVQARLAQVEAERG